MEVIVHSISPSSGEPRHFTVAASLDGAEHQFELVVREEPVRYVDGDQNFNCSFLGDPMKMRDICRLVFDIYYGKAVHYPIVLDA